MEPKIVLNDGKVEIVLEKNVKMRLEETPNGKRLIFYTEDVKKHTSKRSEDSKIINYLRKYKISEKGGGFKYLISAIKLTKTLYEQKQEYTLDSIVYKQIAEMYSTTISGVSRAIENALSRSKAKGLGSKAFILNYIFNNL